MAEMNVVDNIIRKVVPILSLTTLGKLDSRSSLVTMEPEQYLSCTTSKVSLLMMCN